jgi:hypothetical protein
VAYKTQKTPEIEIEANLSRIHHGNVYKSLLQVVITNHTNSPREIISINVRRCDGSTIKLARPIDDPDLLPLIIEPDETKTIESLYHKSVEIAGTDIVVEDDLHKVYCALIT